MVEDGTKKVKLRPRALLETHMKLIESVAVNQGTDHLVTLMQTQQVKQVGFRVTHNWLGCALQSLWRRNEGGDPRMREPKRKAGARIRSITGSLAKKHADQCDVPVGVLEQNV